MSLFYKRHQIVRRNVGNCLGLVLLCSILSSVSWGQDSPQVATLSGGTHGSGAVASDAEGNYYIGTVAELANRTNVLTVLKLNASGQFVWRWDYDGSLGGPASSAEAIVLDAAGNVIVTGAIRQSTAIFVNEFATLTAKLNANGDLVWQRATSFKNSSGGSVAIGTDSNNAITVAARERTDTSGGSNSIDWLLLHYSADGELLWQRHVDGASHGFDLPRALVVDSHDNIVVTGTVQNVGLGFAADVLTQQYNSAGDLQWSVNHGISSPSTDDDDLPTDLIVAGDDSIYLTGTSGSAESAVVPFLTHYDNNGNIIFSISGDGAGGAGLALDGEGDVIAVGTSGGVAGGPNVHTLSNVDSQGNILWQVTLGTFFRHTRVDSVGNIYIGDSDITPFDRNTDGDFLARKFAADGTQLWQHRFTTQKERFSTAVGVKAIAVNRANDDLLVYGLQSPASGPLDMVFLRYLAGVTPGNPDGPSTPPNPPPNTDTPPNAPENLRGSAVSSSIVILSWQDASDNETGFVIERCGGRRCGNFAIVGKVGINTQSFTDGSVSGKEVYQYRVRAVNERSSSAPSNSVSVRTPRR